MCVLHHDIYITSHDHWANRMSLFILPQEVTTVKDGWYYHRICLGIALVSQSCTRQWNIDRFLMGFDAVPWCFLGFSCFSIFLHVSQCFSMFLLGYWWLSMVSQLFSREILWFSIDIPVETAQICDSPSRHKAAPCREPTMEVQGSAEENHQPEQPVNHVTSH